MLDKAYSQGGGGGKEAAAARPVRRVGTAAAAEAVGEGTATVRAETKS